MKQGGLVLGPKSREQGATLLVMGIAAWGLLFWRRFSALCVSRREDLVDNGTEDSLFGKVRYILSKLPPWMAGRMKHTVKPIKCVNEAMGSMLLGESANVDVGQSRRVTLVIVDEASRFPHGASLMKSLATVGSCTALVSTPNGPGTEFSKLCVKQTKEPAERVKLLTLGYEDSPTHGRGRTWTIDEDGSITGKKGGGFWETPAFRLARAASANPKDWRENWLRDHDTSGLLVLNSNAIAAMRQGVREPRMGKIVDGRFVDYENGRLALWGELQNDGLPARNTNFVIGCDFGQGVEKANTVLAVMDRKTGIIFGEYVDPTIDPYEAVPIVMDLSKFFCGDYGDAFVIWENNGPGYGFGREIVRRFHPWLYYQKAEQSGDSNTKQWGWTSTPARKEIAFSDFNRALTSGHFTTYSAAGLDDMAAWMFDEHRRIVCGTRRDETSGAQAGHGDRAIAYMLCVKGGEYVYEPEPPDEPRYPSGSIGALLGHAEVWDRIHSGEAAEALFEETRGL